jgi:rod shape-determining protein MreD
LALLRFRHSEEVDKQPGARRALLTTPVILVATIVAMAVLQTHWPGALESGGAKPDLLLLLVLYFAFSAGPGKAIGIGLLVGFLEDTLSGGPLGLNIFCKVLVGYTVGLVSTRLITEHAVVMTSIAFLSTVCQTALVVLLSFLYRDDVPVKAMFLHVGIPMAFYNSLLALPCYFCLDRLLARASARAMLRGEGVQQE